MSEKTSKSTYLEDNVVKNSRVNIFKNFMFSASDTCLKISESFLSKNFFIVLTILEYLFLIGYLFNDSRNSWFDPLDNLYTYIVALQPWNSGSLNISFNVYIIQFLICVSFSFICIVYFTVVSFKKSLIEKYPVYVNLLNQLLFIYFNLAATPMFSILIGSVF